MSDDASAALEEQLLQRVRAGDSEAFQQLYDAHLDGALQLARILVGRDAADELVSESFARVLSALSGGAGPTENFRAYLHVTIRNGYRDTFRTAQEAPVSDQPWLLDEATPTVEEMVDGLDESAATDALTTLPERWQQVLWHVEVEGRKPAEVAQLMDLSPRTVSSLAHRAREGLKQAYLDLHAGPEPVAEECQWVHARMSKSARGELSARAQRKLDEHLAGCDDCAAAFLVVDTVNQRLAAYVLPLVLLGVVPASGKVVVWLAAAAGGTAVAGGAAGGTTTGAGGSAGSVGSSAGGPVAVAAAVAAVVAGVAGASWALVAHLNGSTDPVAAPVPAAPATSEAGATHSAAPASQPSRSVAARPVVATTPVAAVTRAGSAPTPAPTPAPTAPASTAPASAGSAPTSSAPIPAAATTPTTPTAPVSAPPTTATPPPSPADACGAGIVCTVLTSVSRVVQSATGIQLVAQVGTSGGPDRLVTVSVAFDHPAAVSTRSSDWTCTDGSGGALGTARVAQAVCSFAYAGTPPPALALDVVSSGQQPVSGTITMRSGSDTSTYSFSG